MKYFSEKTKKMYDSVELLETAEKELDEKQEKELKLKEERKARAQEVEEAYKIANNKFNEFIKDYGSWHCSISTERPVKFDVFSSFLDEFFKL